MKREPALKKKLLREVVVEERPMVSLGFNWMLYEPAKIFNFDPLITSEAITIPAIIKNCPADISLRARRLL